MMPASNRMKSWISFRNRVALRAYTFRGEAFASEFLHSSKTVFCPACLLNDDARGGNPAALRRGRLSWNLRVVRTCPEHSLPLVMRDKEIWRDGLHELAIRVPERGVELQALARQGTPRLVSPLQTYVTGRLEGVRGPEWLDRQGLKQAVRASEMLGAWSSARVRT